MMRTTNGATDWGISKMMSSSTCHGMKCNANAAEERRMRLLSDLLLQSNGGGTTV